MNDWLDIQIHLSYECYSFEWKVCFQKEMITLEERQLFRKELINVDEYDLSGRINDIIALLWRESMEQNSHKSFQSRRRRRLDGRISFTSPLSIMMKGDIILNNHISSLEGRSRNQAINFEFLIWRPRFTAVHRFNCQHLILCRMFLPERERDSHLNLRWPSISKGLWFVLLIKIPSSGLRISSVHLVISRSNNNNVYFTCISCALLFIRLFFCFVCVNKCFRWK